MSDIGPAKKALEALKDSSDAFRKSLAQVDAAPLDHAERKQRQRLLDQVLSATAHAPDAYTARFLTPPAPRAQDPAEDPAAESPEAVAIEYDDGTVILALSSQTILDVSLSNDIAHMCVCGGRARCSTCRIVVTHGLENCLPRTEDEAKLASQKGFAPELRLACQTRVRGPVRLRRLVHDDADIKAAFQARSEHVGREVNLAVLFADIRGFTRFSEQTLAYDVVHVLNRYFDGVGSAIDAHGGYIDKYMGDGIMALFGLDAYRDTHPCLDAAMAARQALAGLPGLNAYLQKYLGHEFEIAMGIHFGPTVVGEIGFSERRQFTAIGDTVNAAARLESEAKALGTSVIVSEAVLQHLPDAYREDARSHALELRGKSGVFQAHDISASVARPHG